MDAALRNLFCRLGECHRPVLRPHPDAVVHGVLFLIHCPACNGSGWKSWMIGDPEPTGCKLWREYMAYWRTGAISLDGPSDFDG